MASTLDFPAQCSICKQEMPAGTAVKHRGHASVRHLPNSCPRPAATSGATPKQLAFAQSLQSCYWTPAVFGRDRYTVAELSAMSRGEISRVIDRLIDERDLQTGN